MSDIHLALVTPWDRQGGIANYAERFVSALESVGVTVTVVPIEKTETANPLAFMSLLDDIPEAADVIHIQFEAGLFGRFRMRGVGAPAFFLGLAREGRPVVVTLHEVHAEHSHRGVVGDYLLRGRDTFIERLALRAADATLVHSGEAKHVVEERHGGNWQIERLLHPVDTDAQPIPTDEAKSKLDVEGPTLLTFGFVEEKKRYEDVIRALPSFPELTYLVAGGFREGEGKKVWERCMSLAEELGVADRVRYLGYVDDEDLSVVFSAPDAVVLPYERVSQSGVVNDALAYRRPVVASSLPAFEELREDYQCLLTYADQSGLHECLSMVLIDKVTRINLRQHAEEYVDVVSWERFVERSLKLYENLVVSKSQS